MKLKIIIRNLVLALVFILFITPLGIVMKMFGIDYLRHRKLNSENSYWINKDVD